MSRLLASIAGASMLVASAALAQPPMPENGDGRYTFHRADDGYLRLDGRTGQVSMCIRRPAGWQCQLVPDERAALEAEMARLQSDNATLKKELLTRKLPLPNAIRPEPPASIPNPQGTPAPKEEANRVVRFFETVWRRLVDMVTTAQQDIKKRI